MKKAKSILKDMGFNESASAGSQAAFFNYLLKEARLMKPNEQNQENIIKKCAKTAPAIGEQLSLPLNEVGSTGKSKKKVS